MRSICSNTRVTSALISSSVGSCSATLGRKASLTGAVYPALVSRIASRNSRLIRLRSWALPWRRERNMPYLKPSEGSQTPVQQRAETRRPCLNRTAISTRLFRVKLRGRLFLSGNADSQALTTFGAATAQHLTAVLGRHPATEAVVVQFLTIGRLKRSFHLYSKLILTEPPNIAIWKRPSRRMWRTLDPHYFSKISFRVSVFPPKSARIR